MTHSDGRPRLHVLPGGGAPPDRPRADGASHVTDHLANERTFLAWIRTSIALISLGFVVAKFSVWLRQFQATLALPRATAGAADSTAGAAAPAPTLPRLGVSLPAGMALMAAGALLAVLALRRRRAVDRAIARGEFRPDEDLAISVTGGVVVAAAAFITYLAVSSM